MQQAELVEDFQYLQGDEHAVPWDGQAEVWPDLDDLSGNAGAASMTKSGSPDNRRGGISEARHAEETRQQFDAVREEGFRQGRQAEHDLHASALGDAERHRMEDAAEMVEQFATERDRFLYSVEHEVVALALAVAARILRREAQMDPLLLTGAVRVALGQLSKTTRVRLRVPAAELDLWSETIALLPNLALRPTVLAGEGMLLGDCIVETEMGTVDLGIRAQLGEIERGFFDRAGVDRAPAVARSDMPLEQP